MISDGSNSVLKKEKFFKLLSNVLPTRSQESCYKYILRQFHTMNHKGDWTEEEVDQLLALIDKFGKKWKMIGKEMNRTSDNVYDKYRSLGDDVHGDRVKSIWKIHELLTLLTEI